ncbi:carbohydrate ABC transporter substrate-binding protein, CUT1 family [Chitinophaga jiangningensis]|uniref:Carbohydrate ABC transporter substrate-binding protein, CUT1 family n=1 Tax=Chitinophaga jiangningensis TaxID=1419482 RepID=A0A1M7ABK2_9BACT|nr:extracellular solute-binding protein [Chitinophaga jiangningensis]SHL40131.1 carbohydrate ABC transporter substrate-binding protein, CUT1 family [Chitinophaga jiangningensis]
MARIVLQGITWDHSRGLTPLLAAAQRYQELHPDVEIHWKKRTLQEFADAPIEKLTHHYDLLIIDHPWVGCAAATRCVLPLNQYLPAAYLSNQATHSTGGSHASYEYNGQQWALAIDAATPAASYRKDLLEKHHQPLPATWNDLLLLAVKGKVAVPAIPIDLLMNFYTFCIANGTTPFRKQEEVVDRETGMRAIESMKQLYSLVDKKMFQCNPIAVAELMSRTDDYWYCPFAYGYSNYSRPGFADNLLHYAPVVSFNGKTFRTTVGGTGIAVSAFSKHQDVATDFAAWVTSELIQRTLYVQHGGQPGHRAAWTDATANQLTNNYFQQVLPLMDNGYIRPRYNGYLHFQDHAGLPLQNCLLENANPVTTLEEMNRIYRASLITHQTHATV